MLQVAEHSSKWDSTWLVSEGVARIIARFSLIGAYVSIAKTVVLVLSCGATVVILDIWR